MNGIKISTTCVRERKVFQWTKQAQRKNRKVCNQEKRVGWENPVIKAREKGVLCNSYMWDEADAKLRSYLFLCLGAEGQRQVQQKRPSLEMRNVTSQELMTTLEDIFNTNRIVAFVRYNFICREQKKSESLEQIHADLVELASRADCEEPEEEWVIDMFTMKRSQKNYQHKHGPDKMSMNMQSDGKKALNTAAQ